MAVSGEYAAINTLATYLEGPLPPSVFAAVAPSNESPGQLTGSPIARGWKDQRQDAKYPAIVLDAAPGTRSAFQPRTLYEIDPQDEDINVQILVALATIELPVMCNVFARNSKQRAQVLRALEVAIHASALDSMSGQLALTMLDYSDQPMTIHRSGTPYYMDSTGSVGRDEFRAIMPLTIEYPEVVPMTVARFRKLTIQWDVRPEGTPAQSPLETTTIFDLT